MLPIIILTIVDEDDREYMAALYMDYRFLMFSAAKEIVNDKWLAEDLVQDSIEKLIDKIDLLKTFDKKRLAAYVVVTTKNVAKNHLRGSKLQQIVSFDELEDIDDLASDDDIEGTVISNIIIGNLIDLWGLLTESTQELLERKYILQQDDTEIAQAFGIKPSSVRMRLTRARREVYETLAPSIF